MPHVSDVDHGATSRSRAEAPLRAGEPRRRRTRLRVPRRTQTSCDRILLKYKFGEGGLLRVIERACHLTRLSEQISWLFVLTWVPIVAFGLAREVQTGTPEVLLRDPAVHVRMLIATPLLVALDHVFPVVCTTALRELSNQSFLPRDALPRFDRLLCRVVRVADSNVPELLIALTGISFAVLALHGHVSLRGISLSDSLSAAQKWYLLTDLPLFHFLLWRSLWRWLLWCRLLVGLSRLPLQMVPTHPDRSGGIGFLRYPSILYCAALLFVVSAVVCAEWGSRFGAGQTLASFKPLLLLFGSAGALIAFGPLLVFTPLLVRARSEGLKYLGGFAARSGRRFRRHLSRDPRPSPARYQEVDGLTAMATTYRESVNSISYVLIRKRDVLVLLAATLAPLVPVMLATVPQEDWLVLVDLLTGSVPLP